MDEQDKTLLIKSALKKAAGYEAVETQEEYSLVEGDMTLVKRRITRKDVPPDITAIKLLLGDGGDEPVTMEELERERAELTERYLSVAKKKKIGGKGANGIA